MESKELFQDVGATDFLGFEFNKRSYAAQLSEAVAKTNRVCAVNCYLKQVGEQQVIWLDHEFGFLGGSLGCAEGEKLVLGIEKAIQDRLPVIIECKSGGARMQEGLLSLMQMAKVSVAVQALKKKGLPLVTLCRDPTYGGVSASYAMQGHVRVSVKDSRIGFAGPAVILNTVYGMDQAKYDAACPDGFQSAEYLLAHGQLDIVVNNEAELGATLAKLMRVMRPAGQSVLEDKHVADIKTVADSIQTKQTSEPDYLTTRALDRYLSQDIIGKLFTDFIDLVGDGKMGRDPCMHGGVAMFEGVPCVVIAQFKGHNPVEMKNANFGMPSPHGYRTALKLMNLAEQLRYPVFTLVDTPGAFPSFASEQDGQSEALASNFLKMSGLTVPIITLLVGEGGSGGALGIAMGNRIAMLSKGYYGVISPEGAASILGRYANDEEKAKQFPKDCAALAVSQKVYAHDLKKLGCVDEVIEETDGENYKNFPDLAARIRSFFARSLLELQSLTPEVLESDRYTKFRSMGKYEMYTPEKKKALAAPKTTEAKSKPSKPAPPPASRTLDFVAYQTLNSKTSAFHSKQPKDLIEPIPIFPKDNYDPAQDTTTFKYLLDTQGVAAVVDRLKKSQSVHICDTTLRDAHQSLLSTRVRTYDMMLAAEEMAHKLKSAFSLEMWGGATYDVSYRFLHESPWDRLRMLRKKIPNIMFQMLIRGANAVGYKSYPDNVVKESIRLAALNGIDVFRIFDCFNEMEQMQLCIDAVHEAKKICEVAICFSGNFLSADEHIYTLDYYKGMVKKVVDAGADIVAIKDMAGLVRPQMAKPLMEAIRSISDVPVHFHTHNTSSAALLTCVEMARAGCNVVDLASAAMADTTSQPSLNAFVAAMEGMPHAPEGFTNFMELENLDQLWGQIRSQYSMYESGLKSGTARVYNHEIPGGQFSNLYEQCKSMGLMHRWSEVLDMYHEVNMMFGNLIKVTPSSKCVGDMALFMITRNLTIDDIRERGETIDYPDSIIDLCTGNLGTPHHGLPADIVAKVLRGKPRMQGRPGANLPPTDLVALKAELEQKYMAQMEDEDVISAALYPKVFSDYMAQMKKYGNSLQFIETCVFFHGMKLGQETVMTVPAHADKPSCTYKVKLLRVGPLKEGNMRTLEFSVNGNMRFATVKDTTKDVAKSTLAQADAADPKQIGSPLPGAIDKISVAKGALVKEGQVMMIVCAMKLEVNVSAPFEGVVESIKVENGSKVDQGTLLVVVKPAEKQQMMPHVDSLADLKPK